MHEHYLLDNPPVQNSGDFDDDTVENATEHYEDPEFDSIWDNLDELQGEELRPEVVYADNREDVAWEEVE